MYERIQVYVLYTRGPSLLTCVPFFICHTRNLYCRPNFQGMHLLLTAILSLFAIFSLLLFWGRRHSTSVMRCQTKSHAELFYLILWCTASGITAVLRENSRSWMKKTTRTARFRFCLTSRRIYSSEGGGVSFFYLLTNSFL